VPNKVVIVSLPKALLSLPVHVLIVNRDNTDNTSRTNSNVRFLTCSCTSYISRAFSYCRCLAAWKAVGLLEYTLTSLLVSLGHAWVSYPSPDSAAVSGAVAAPVLAVADAAAAELKAVAAEVEDLGTPCCVLLAMVVVVGAVLLVLDGPHCSRWESGLG